MFSHFTNKLCNHKKKKKRLSHSQGKMQQRKEQGVESERGASRQKITYH